MSEIIHRARGWHAVFDPKPFGLQRLPGDTPESLAALRALAHAGLLGRPPGDWRCRPCPRCWRPTPVAADKDPDSGSWTFTLPTVCTACRAEWLADHGVMQADMAAAEAEIGDRLTRFLARLRAAKRKAGHAET